MRNVFSWLAHAGVFFVLYGSASAQPAPLSFETADQATGYMEWVLDLHFDAGQRQQYQQILAEMWRGNQGSKDTIAAMARTYQSLSTLDENQRAQMRARQQSEFVR